MLYFCSLSVLVMVSWLFNLINRSRSAMSFGLYRLTAELLTTLIYIGLAVGMVTIGRGEATTPPSQQ